MRLSLLDGVGAYKERW